jgi:hypothetical protein
VDAGVDGVLLDGIGEPAVVPAVIVDVAEDGDDLGKAGYVELVAVREAPPDVEGVQPLGYNTLRETNPQEALELLARGDNDVQNAVAYAEQRRAAGERSEGEWDDIRPIDPAEALGLRDEPTTREA